MNPSVLRRSTSDFSPASGARGLDSLAHASLWVFVLTLPWADEIPTLGDFVIGRWIGLLAVGLGLMRSSVVRSARPLSPIHFWMLAYVAWAVLSVFWTIDLNITVSRAGTYVQLLIATWLIWDLGTKENRVLGLLQAYVLGTALGSISVLFNYWNGAAASSFFGGGGDSEWDTNRFTISGFNANDLGLTLALSIPMAFYLLTRKKGIGWNIFLWMFLVLCPIAILLTGSRGSILAIAASTVMLPFLMVHMTPARRVACIVIPVAIVAGCVGWVPEGTLERYQTIYDEIQAGTLTHRTVIWTAGLEVFRDNALIGTGAGSYGTAVLNAIDIPYVAHNTFLSVLVELGVVGAFLFGGLLASICYAAARLPRPEKYFWLAMLLTWAIGVSVLTWEYRKPTWFLFAILAAHAHSFRAVPVRRAILSSSKPWVPSWERPDRPRVVNNI